MEFVLVLKKTINAFFLIFISLLWSPGSDIELFSCHLFFLLPQDSKSLPQIRKSFPQVSKSLPQDIKLFPQVRKSLPKDTNSFAQVRSRYHKILTHSHKLGKSLPQDTNSFPQVNKVITTRY